jgi:VanZ family protein
VRVARPRKASCREQREPEAEPGSARREPRAAWGAWAAVLLWAGLIFALSSVPDLGTGLGTWDLLLRKLAHAAEYAVLGLLLLRATRQPRLALGLGVLYAISDEVHQHFVEGRIGSPLDVLVDAVGVAIGIGIWQLAQRRLAA